MDRVEKMLGRMKASKLYRCVDWDPEGKAKDLVDKFNSCLLYTSDAADE